MLFKLILNVVYLILIGVCVHYSYLYTHISEDINEIKITLKKLQNKSEKNKDNRKKPTK
jgi:hypothetical protein